MSHAKWLGAAIVPGIERRPLKKLNAGPDGGSTAERHPDPCTARGPFIVVFGTAAVYHLDARGAAYDPGLLITNRLAPSRIVVAESLIGNDSCTTYLFTICSNRHGERDPLDRAAECSASLCLRTVPYQSNGSGNQIGPAAIATLLPDNDDGGVGLCLKAWMTKKLDLSTLSTPNP